MRKILWATVFYTILVIVWGAWVRISHSGDGCGASWPHCLDQIIPQDASGKTWIEYTHRAMSGLYGILLIWLAIWIPRQPEASTQTRFWMKLSFIFMITEALLGAVLVKGGFVGSNDTPARAFVMALHFLNSLFLTGSLTLCALFAVSSKWKLRPWSEVKGVSQRLIRRVPTGGLVLFLMIGLTGTVAALSNTLYPESNLLAGILKDFDPESHYLIQLRGMHPAMGLMLGIGMTIFFYLISEALDPSLKEVKKKSFILSVGCAFTVIAGATTLLLHAPVAMKLIHLMMAHGLWILMLQFWQSLRYEAQA